MQPLPGLEITMLSKREELFLLRQTEKLNRKKQRKLWKQLNHKKFDFTQFEVNSINGSGKTVKG